MYQPALANFTATISGNYGLNLYLSLTDNSLTFPFSIFTTTLGVESYRVDISNLGIIGFEIDVMTTCINTSSKSLTNEMIEEHLNQVAIEARTVKTTKPCEASIFGPQQGIVSADFSLSTLSESFTLEAGSFNSNLNQKELAVKAQIDISKGSTVTLTQSYKTQNTVITVKQK